MKSLVHCLRVSLVVLLALCGLAALATPAIARTEQVAICTQKAKSLGTKVPVLMVHGLLGTPRKWEAMEPVLRQNGEVYTDVFGYSASSTQWVTHPSIGPKLAETIACYAKASRDNGGRGKIVLVTHSMGGLAARYAADRVGGDIGLIVTIGTPHQGSILGNASSALLNSLCQATFPLGRMLQQYVTKENCVAGLAVHGLGFSSSELGALPVFPANIPVKAIAGNVTPRVQLGNVVITAKAPNNSDLVVGVGSATAEYTETGQGDGRRVFGCTGTILVPSISDASCEHTNMLHDKGVQQEVVQAIRDYLGQTSGTPHIFFHKMTLLLPADAESPAYHGEGASSYEVACPSPWACPTFSVYDPEEVGGDLGWYDWTLRECSVATERDDPSLSTHGPIVEKGRRYIGTKPARYYEAELCVPGVRPETARYWEAEDGSIFVMAVDTDDRRRNQLDAILAGATWQ